MSYQIMIVEDDAKIAGAIHAYLTRYGYRPVLLTDFENILAEFQRLQPDLVLLDVNLPYLDGFHICRQIRRSSSVPVLFVTARAGDMEQVIGIESGGDDYITKPFHLDVLHAKIKAILRRTYGEYAKQDAGRAQTHAGDLYLDLAAGEMHFAGLSQALTRTELKLLDLLIQRADRIVSREECLEALWDDRSFVDDNTLTVNVNRLRTKLDAWGLKDAVETRRGIGYQLISERLKGGRP